MACIPVVDPNCNPVTDLAASAAQKFLDELAAQAAQGAADMLKIVVTGWLAIPSPEVSQDSGPVAYLRGYTNWAVGAIAVGALLVVALRMAWDRNGREAGSAVRGLAIMVVLTGAGVPAVRLLSEIGDLYSTWILDRSAGGDLGAKLLLFAPVAGAPPFSGLTALVVLGISLMLLFAAVLQFLFLLARGAGLILLTGLLPLVAAAGITGGGRALRDRYLTWLLAFLLYKPAAATIYAGAFWALGDADDLTSVLTGLVMLCMAIVALPALMRLIAPAVSAVSAGGGGGVAGAAAGGAVQVASGAVRLAGSGGGSGAGGGRPAGTSGPSGSGHSAPSPRSSGGSGGSPAAVGAGSSTAGKAAAGSGGGAAAGGATAGTGAGAAGAGAAGAGAGAAAAAGPVGIGIAAGAVVAKAAPAAVREAGGTASGAVEGDQ